MTTPHPSEREDKVPAIGLFGRKCAVPVDLGPHKNRRDGAKALFGRKAAEAA